MPRSYRYCRAQGRHSEKMDRLYRRGGNPRGNGNRFEYPEYPHARFRVGSFRLKGLGKTGCNVYAGDLLVIRVGRRKRQIPSFGKQLGYLSAGACRCRKRAFSLEHGKSRKRSTRIFNIFFPCRPNGIPLFRQYAARTYPKRLLVEDDNGLAGRQFRIAARLPLRFVRRSAL